jgi:predicted DNA-binding transcriptional regulator YafY
VKLRLNSLEEVEGWILGFGAHADDIQPQALRDRVRETAKIITAKYAKDAKDGGS